MSSVPKSQPLYTIDEYLTMERAASERHIYLDGQIYAMAGESLAHGRITVNLGGIFYIQLRGKPCEAFTKETKVRSGPFPSRRNQMAGLFSYPDILVVCGEPEHHDAFKDVILNPKVIVEVLPESTQAFNRGEKFKRYKTYNPTLTDYVLVSQDKPEIEHHQRQANGKWSKQVHTDLAASVVITSIQCTLKLADVYERVKFIA